MKAILIGATHSGCGKTTFCIGLARALQRCGVRVQCFKVGPDYLDPTWLAMASQNTCINLDIWMMGINGMHNRFAQAQTHAQVALIEGVMGLYDGVNGANDFGSSAHVARELDIPVLLIADASGTARSFAATVEGFAYFSGCPTLLGVVANRTGSISHFKILEESMQSIKNPPPLLGHLPKNGQLSIPSRHLGLFGSMHYPESHSIIESLADSVKKSIDIEKLLGNLPEWDSKIIEFSTEKFTISPTARCRIALAQDAAFSFQYAGMLNVLKQSGAEVLPFSPINDKWLPENVDGLILPGGYPEIYAEELSQNISMLESIRVLAAQGIPIYAECGGLMYASQGIECARGKFSLLGLLGSWVRMENSLQRLGYVEIEFKRDCLIGTKGTHLRGHEFHYSRLLNNLANSDSIFQCRDSRGTEIPDAGWQQNSLVASFVHIPWDIYPDTAKFFINQCCKLT